MLDTVSNAWMQIGGSTWDPCQPARSVRSRASGAQDWPSVYAPRAPNAMGRQRGWKWMTDGRRNTMRRVRHQIPQPIPFFFQSPDGRRESRGSRGYLQAISHHSSVRARVYVTSQGFVKESRSDVNVAWISLKAKSARVGGLALLHVVCALRAAESMHACDRRRCGGAVTWASGTHWVRRPFDKRSSGIPRRRPLSAADPASIIRSRTTMQSSGAIYSP